MSGFTSDTSGYVELTDFVRGGATSWSPGKIAFSGLDPFTQGYVETLFADTPFIPLYRNRPEDTQRPPRFSDLAPETLAVILKDCGQVGAASGQGSITFMHERGKQFWRVRNIKGLISGLTHFPPVTPYLGDDGKVYLSAAQ